MNNKEKEIMRKLVEMMTRNGYVLEDDSSQVDFNVYAVTIFEQILDMDYIKPFEVF